jgi:hypothetical protein
MTTTTDLVVRLIIDGYTVIPDVLSPDEIAAMHDAFESLAAHTGKRWFDWQDIATLPPFAAYIGHPRLMSVVEPFVAHFGHEAVFANASGVRDVFDPSKPVGKWSKDLKKGLGWHDDVMGMKHPKASFLPTTLNTLLYLDDTFADNGAYTSAVGSHHLATVGPNDKPVHPPREMVLDHCKLVPVPVKAGSVILSRAYHWHGVIPPRQRRRVMLQTFCSRELYDMQAGHTQLGEETLALIPRKQQKWIMSYARA